MAGVCGASARLGRVSWWQPERWLIRRHRPATRANAPSTFDVDHTRQIVHLRPVETVHCHPVTDRSPRPTSYSDLPRTAVAQFNASAHECRNLGDHGTAAKFDEMVLDEEGHSDWFEAQLAAIDIIGAPANLAQQTDAATGPA